MCNIRTAIQFRTHRFPGYGLCVKKIGSKRRIASRPAGGRMALGI